MKKIIALFIIMLAFGTDAQAQKKKTAATATPAAATQQTSLNEEAANAAAKDLKLLSEFIVLTKDQKESFTQLFTYKHRTLLEHKDNFSAERRSILAENIESKIKSGVSPDQVAKLEDNPDLMKRLTNTN